MNERSQLSKTLERLLTALTYGRSDARNICPLCDHALCHNNPSCPVADAAGCARRMSETRQQRAAPLPSGSWLVGDLVRAHG
jgi:hypothetical protein